MGKRPATFTEADIKRAVRATMATGLAVQSVSVDKDGVIRVETKPQLSIGPIDAPKEWHF